MQISSSDLLLCFYGYKHVQCFVDKYMVFKLYSGIKKNNLRVLPQAFLRVSPVA